MPSASKRQEKSPPTKAFRLLVCMSMSNVVTDNQRQNGGKYLICVCVCVSGFCRIVLYTEFALLQSVSSFVSHIFCRYICRLRLCSYTRKRDDACNEMITHEMTIHLSIFYALIKHTGFWVTLSAKRGVAFRYARNRTQPSWRKKFSQRAEDTARYSASL